MESPSLASFLASIPFDPDPFQVSALESVVDGRSVVVTAPTGAGKTLIADGAISLTLAAGSRAFYTTPIKALSNQKYHDLLGVHGASRVGLLTGDNVINGDAPIIVMTTEVLRNMIYESSHALDDLGVVILDEVHYLADRHRGSVWEEVIIHLDRAVPLVCLSATIANPEEFTSWVRSRRGDVDLVVEEHRPVPLTSMYMWRDRNHGNAISMRPVFDRAGRPDRGIANLLQRSRGRHRRFSTPRRAEVIELLRDEGLLPAIYFVFSRKGCDASAEAVAAAGLELTTADERQRIDAVVERHVGHLSDQDLTVLGYERWKGILARGAAAHHAGMVPAFKEAVEELFLHGLVKVVAATETLALGINMPARTVVLESLSKFNGETHELLAPSDYTQLTGRAGRRGIDDHGTAVVLHSSYVPFDRVAGIAAAGSNPLRSSFAPTYNMTVNLIARYDEARAHELLAASFANFSDRQRREQLSENLAARRRDLATFEAAAADGDEMGEWAERARRAERDIRRLRRRIDRQARQTVVQDFDNLHGVLDALGYTKRWSLLAPGQRLRRLYNELDLLLAESLRAGFLDGLDPATFAAVVSVFTYEARGGELSPFPVAAAAGRPLDQIRDRWHQICDVEDHHGVEPTREPDMGLVDTISGWAHGLELDDIFDSDDIRAGDFVRAARQVLDLLRQVRDAYPGYAQVADAAILEIDRGIVDTGRGI